MTVSSTISDIRADPFGPVAPVEYGWWGPPVDVGHAEYQIIFERLYTIDNIHIKWKERPPKAEISVLLKSG